MKQVLHIFRKDARHFWLESAVSIAVVAAFAWSEVRSWTAPDDFSTRFIGFLKGLPTILVLLSWWFVIARVVQDEALVGDRQFWITRPYEWQKLLAAKVLYVAVFINLPLFIVDIFLLAKAGFNPVSYIPGLLWMQLMLAVFLLLPMAALATVTSNVVQMGLASLIVFLYLGGVAALYAHIPSSSFSFESEDLQALILIGTASMVIVWQYAQRKTAKSRWLIAGTAGVIVLMAVATPYGILVARNYPQLAAGQQPPVQLALAPVKPHAPVEENDFSKKEPVQIYVPWNISGLANESIVVVNGIMVMIEAPNHVRWDSGWLSQATFLYPGQRGAQLSFELPRDLYERVKTIPVKTNISLIKTVYQDKNRREFVTPSGEFALPDVGLCVAKAGWSNTMDCRSALRKPTSLLVSSDSSLTTCAARKGAPPTRPGEMGHAWQSNSDPGPAEFGFSPIQTFNFYLTPANGSVEIRGICPGTPLVLSNPEEVQRLRTSLEIDGMRLADYRFIFGPFEFDSR